MSFLPSMHGTFQHYPSFNPHPADQSSMTMEMSQATALKIAELQAKLDKKLGPEYISTRPGPGGNQKLTYAEGWKIINLANEIFGFNGWSSSVVSLTVDFMDVSEGSGRISVGVTAIVRVTLRDGVFHEDIGYGMLENSKSKAQALDKVIFHLFKRIYASCSIFIYGSARRKLLLMVSSVPFVALATF